MKCSSCGLIFDSPRPTQETIVQHYSRPEQYDDWLQTIKDYDRLWLRRVRKLRRHALPGSLLDVGAGIGLFLSHARPYFTEITGTEVSKTAIAFASENYGLRLHQGIIESLDLQAVDNLTIFHILEHVMNPGTTLKRCYELTKPGGRIFVCVPNDILSWTSRLRAFKNRVQPRGKSPITGLPHWEACKEIHLSHFTPQSLAFGVKAAGFRIISLENDPYYAVSGLKLLLHAANYMVHQTLRLPTYQAIWLVAERPLASQ
jgi:SAM-dependent methyltransferase